MNGIRGFYCDGRNAARQEVMVFREGEELVIRGAESEIRHATVSVRVSSPLGSLNRTIRFPDGSACEVAESEDLTTALGVQGGRLAGMVGSWERSLPLAFGALLLTALLVTGLVKYGIPFLAQQVASAIPPATEKVLGRDTLDLLDRMIFSPSKLSEARRKEIENLFRGMVAELSDRRSYRLEFRSAPGVGANAFALPSGIIVVTDDLAKLAKSNEELLGVLAHETAHVRKRHALRQLLQNSATTLVIAFITGDVLSITSLSATLPGFLIDASYSRDFEREADDEAVAFLDRRKISRKSYADMLVRLEKQQHRKSDKPNQATEKESASPADWFSTHPDTAERVRRIHD